MPQSVFPKNTKELQMNNAHCLRFNKKINVVYVIFILQAYHLYFNTFIKKFLIIPMFQLIAIN